MSELWYSQQRGKPNNPGTYDFPLLDPSTGGVVDAKYIEPGKYAVAAGRVKANKYIGAYGAGDTPPHLVSGSPAATICLDLINNNNMVVENLEISDYPLRGLHGGSTLATATEARNNIVRNVYIHDIGIGADDATAPSAVQTWGALWKWERLVVDRVEGDCFWSYGADLDMDRCSLSGAVGPSGDALQAWGLSTTVRLRSVVATHFSRQKQCILLSGSGTLRSCDIDGVVAQGASAGAGLWTVQGIRGIVARNTTLVMYGGPSLAGVGFIDGGGGTFTGGTWTGYGTAVSNACAGQNSSGCTGRLIGIRAENWRMSGIVIEPSAAAATIRFRRPPLPEICDTDSWRRARERAERELCDMPKDMPEDAPQMQWGRDALGEQVRLAWAEWARAQPNPDPGWLIPWSMLTDADKELARRVGERLYSLGHATPPREPWEIAELANEHRNPIE